jgi:hypothetical protein
MGLEAALRLELFVEDMEASIAQVFLRSGNRDSRRLQERRLRFTSECRADFAASYRRLIAVPEALGKGLDGYDLYLG